MYCMYIFGIIAVFVTVSIFELEISAIDTMRMGHAHVKIIVNLKNEVKCCSRTVSILMWN